MPETFDCSVPASLLTGVRQAKQALSTGGLIVMPTDTVYGIAADAFSHEAVAALLAAKGRGRQSPPPVLVGNVDTLNALAASVPPEARALIDAHWPGPLTIIFKARSSLRWDLGDTKGTVALRMPDHDIARAVLTETGPLAVSSANLHGQPAHTHAAGAAEALGEHIACVLDAGEVGTNYTPHGEQQGSTIIDATGENLTIVRQGVLSKAAIDLTLAEHRASVAAAEAAAAQAALDEARQAESPVTDDGTPAS